MADEPTRDLPPEYGYEILRSGVGSTLHGISVGNDDRDEMGVCVEPQRFVLGLDHFEQYIYRSAAVREGRQDAHSQPGDLDLVVYSLRKWARLALKGNPTVLLLLFSNSLVIAQPEGIRLQEVRDAFISRRAGDAFLGYVSAQKARYLRERGTARVPNRDDKDRKYLAHLMRLGYQGVELLENGTITLPMPEDQRARCIEARTSADPQDVLTEVGRLERELQDLLTSSWLPREPDRDAVNEFLAATYETVWSALGAS